MVWFDGGMRLFLDTIILKALMRDPYKSSRGSDTRLQAQARNSANALRGDWFLSTNGLKLERLALLELLVGDGHREGLAYVPVQ